MKRQPSHSEEEKARIHTALQAVAAEHLDSDRERATWLVEIMMQQAYVPWPAIDREDQESLAELSKAVRKSIAVFDNALSPFAAQLLNEAVWEAGGSPREAAKQFRALSQALAVLQRQKGKALVNTKPDGKHDPFRLQVISAARRGWYFAFEDTHPPKSLNEAAPFAAFLVAVLIAFGLRSEDDQTGVRGLLETWAKHKHLDPSDTDEDWGDYVLTPEDIASINPKSMDEDQIS